MLLPSIVTWRGFLLATASCLLLGTRDAPAEPIRDAEKLRSVVDGLVEPIIGAELVGCVIGVSTPEIDFVQGYGGVTPGGPSPDGKTIYEIGSITKAFTGTLLADAVQRGELDVDDPVNKWLPEDAQTEANEQPVTLRHLATHTSGFGPAPANMRPEDPERPFDGYGTDLLIASLSGYKPPKPPGEYAYSNYAMGTLGLLLERATGQSYENLLNERILTPLAMSDTTLVVSDEDEDRFAPPHIDAVLPGYVWNLGEGMRAAGALRSTADDLLLFAKAVIDARRGQSAADSAVHNALELATTPHHEGGPVIGLGWHRAQDGITWWHNGQTGAYSSWLSCSPEPMGLGYVNIVVLSNSANPIVSRLGQELAKATLGLPTESLISEPEFVVAEETLAKYRGLYALTPFAYIEVRPGKDRIYARLTGQGTAAVMPTAEHTFKYQIVDAKLVFDLPEGAEHAKSLTLFQNGMELVAPRVGDVKSSQAEAE